MAQPGTKADRLSAAIAAGRVFQSSARKGAGKSERRFLDRGGSQGPSVGEERIDGVSPEDVFTRSVPVSHRKQFGQFFTPQPIAELMCDWLSVHRPKSILDPAAGPGIFVRTLRARGMDGRIVAIDKDPLAVTACCQATGHLENVEVRCADFLVWNDSATFDAVIANPPYLRHHDLHYDHDIFGEIGKRNGIRLSRLTNIYGLFMLEICRRLSAGGRAAILVPGEWLNANFGVPLKHFLLENRLLKCLVYFSHAESVFADVLTTACLLFVSKPANACEIDQPIGSSSDSARADAARADSARADAVQTIFVHSAKSLAPLRHVLLRDDGDSLPKSEQWLSARIHTADQHTADQHAADQHTADQHTADQHAADQHAADQHTDRSTSFPSGDSHGSELRQEGTTDHEAREDSPPLTVRRLSSVILLGQAKWNALLEHGPVTIPEGFVPLQQLATTRRGIATGANQFFHVSMKALREAELTIDIGRPCVGRAADVRGYVFSTADFQQLEQADKRTRLLSFHEPLTEAARQYLAEGVRVDLPKRYLLAARNPWYAMETRPPSPIWAAVFGRKELRFIWNEAGVQNLTTFHCIYPQQLNARQIQALVACLNSTWVQQLAGDQQRVYGGGLLKYEPRDLLRIPVPDIRSVSQRTLERFVELLPSLNAAKLNPEHWSEVQRQLRDAVQKAAREAAMAGKRSGDSLPHPANSPA